MRVLIVGEGGREHALAWKISQSPLVTDIFCFPGNPGMAQVAECVDIEIFNRYEVTAFAKDYNIDLAIIGPEAPLIDGLADFFRSVGIQTFGPSRKAAAIEGSKIYGRLLTRKYKIPHALFRVFDNPVEAREYAEIIYSPGPRVFNLVIKADGEAYGKGVFICKTLEEALQAIQTIMIDHAFPKAGDRIIVEEELKGPEASFIVITDSRSIVPLIPVQDYKRVWDNDLGPNTGGMGGYAPVPIITPEICGQIMDTIIEPTLRAMFIEGCPFTGVLYTGIMLTDDGPKVLEYNCRFGDPETQVALPLLETDLIDIIQASLDGSLTNMKIKWQDKSSVCVILASGGYPGKYEKEKVINGLAEAEKITGVNIFHAGTALREDGVLVTSGGRVLSITAVAEDYHTAIDNAYKAVGKIHFNGMRCRSDIGQRAITPS
ncbi:MAG: Phosphoribosylamine-glycine ligase [Berkelbacteria bacterium GW2011_GWB1_38_5]|uniref:Phosphoribosylamine--glycine ligase n=2 Tax=Candidatus Berkelbacteria TaxID=1618330 RepID=A0A0G0FIG9_9BACT|nr:MAG: Phosphoribosylamine-glycine ligase [Berkelbacteria bacterium GW2011_GWA1_36_9]KKQ73890.1 MAG: Phosphoribosylamine-glycine ligase [Berkelbacteria bacterium GW2011_GWB1_38_5]